MTIESFTIDITIDIYSFIPPQMKTTVMHHKNDIYLK